MATHSITAALSGSVKILTRPATGIFLSKLLFSKKPQEEVVQLLTTATATNSLDKKVPVLVWLARNDACEERQSVWFGEC